MKPYFQVNLGTIYCGDARNMSEVPNECVQMVCTSPPYWGLRKYEGDQELIWGDKDCEHEWQMKEGKYLNMVNAGEANRPWQEQASGKLPDSGFCSLCNAWKGAFGLEPTPELYVQHTIEILREVRRVLRKDGVCFWNIGDSYGSSGGFDKQDWNRGIGGKSMHLGRAKSQGILKPKDLCLIPFRIAIAAQQDGWWVRSVIIWNKPNPMPESVTDRPTNSYEFILMLTKSKKYYWDADAVRESYQPSSLERIKYPLTGSKQGDKSWAVNNENWADRFSSIGRNLRDVWTFPTQPYPEAHFAVFPEKLPELCIKAATSEKGCCPKCGAPWARVTKRESYDTEGWAPAKKDPHKELYGSQSFNRVEGKNVCGKVKVETLGWRPTCNCGLEPVPCVVMDNFCGTGTTLWEAKKLGRRGIGYDISKAYCQLAVERNRQMVMEYKG